MRQMFLPLLLLLGLTATAAEKLPVAPAPRAAAKKVSAVVTTSLKTGRKQIRQFAFDDDPSTYFESDKNASKDDHFTLTFDAAVAVSSIQVLTGKPDGSEVLAQGLLEISSDGKKFETAATFDGDGLALARLKNKSVLAVRIRPAGDLTHPLAIREIWIDSKPKVAIFKYPVEFVVDSDAPELKDWINKAGQICEKQYSMICDELMTPGFKPYTVIYMSLKSDYSGVAQASGDHITGSVKYFKDHPDDFGAMVHETSHCVQRYRSRGNPGWLVEGVADYVRFFKYEPGKIGRLNVDRARYDGSYRTTAAFLNFASEKYDPRLVSKLNAIMREGKYTEDVWKEITGKPVEELNQEWRKSLVK